jgi:eukaryotic-like serine/threonine-protein kinase
MSTGFVLAGRYRLISKLGQGGMGAVWRAEDMTLGAEVAVKLIDPAFADSAEALKRFRREAQAAARIRSTYVVQILDHGVDNGTPYIAMELLKGESLAQRLKSVGRLSVEQTGRILGHAGRALALAHENGIVHRDMKPENIFLVREDEEDVGKVLDFGIARQFGGLADGGELKTRTGAILGTPYYMSPEQATGQAVDNLTDIWSFGVIASECLTGRRVFDSESLGGLFHTICMLPLPVPSELGPVPAGFNDWFARAVARDKVARFQTIKEATDRLRALCGRTSSALPYPVVGGDSARLSSIAAPLAVPVAGFQTTSVPSSRSIQVLLRPIRSNLKLLTTLGVALAIVGLYASWRWGGRRATNVATTSVASVTVSAHTAPAKTMVPAAPVSAPILVEKFEAHVSTVETSTRTVAKPPLLPATRRQGLPAAASARTATPLKRDNNAAGI